MSKPGIMSQAACKNKCGVKSSGVNRHDNNTVNSGLMD